MDSSGFDLNPPNFLFCFRLF